MGSDRKRWIRGTLWTVVVVAAAVVWVRHETSLPVRPVEDALHASPLHLVDLDGQRFSLEDLRGSVVLVNLWASWCGPCRAEAPALSRLQKNLGSGGFEVVAVNVESEPPQRVRELARELGMDYRVALPAEPLSGTFGESQVLPSTWLVDREGRVRAFRGGLLREPALEAACRRLLDEG
jgi:thiol-disulfide isomerase/thioredoxin